jgi:hypothetical protein
MKQVVLTTFGSGDVVLKTGECKILSISVFCDTEIGMLVLVDNNGDRIAMAGGAISSVEHFTPSQPIRSFGCTMSDTPTTLDANDVAIVHFA